MTVAGKVYPQEEVNYYIYGIWMRLLRLSEFEGETLIYGYRQAFWQGTGIEGRAAWFRAGLRGDFSEAEGTAYKSATPSTEVYQKPMYFWIGGSRIAIRATDMGDGTVLDGFHLYDN